MNLAIIIAVHEYANNKDNLPGCLLDGKLVDTIIRGSNRFDEILYISDLTSSASVKAKVVEFIERFRASDIDDVFFYFTGHGYFDGSEFYYILSDYDRGRLRQTSISNSDLDSWLRALSPKIAIKIVDACNSGTSYVKDVDSFKKAIQQSENNFKKCYFMFSSQQEQTSFQNSQLSYFTESFARAIIDHGGTTIRYKDISDYISDYFESVGGQTPTFVIQADLIEIFCDVTQKLKQELTDLISTSQATSIVTQTNKSNVDEELIKLVMAEAATYSDESDATEAIRTLSSSVSESTKYLGSKELYQYEVMEVADQTEVPAQQFIGEWLTKTIASPPVFAEPVTTRVTKTKRVRKNSSFTVTTFSLLGNNNDDDENYKTVEYVEREVIGFKSNTTLPFSLIRVNAEPKFKNIPASVLYLLPLFSRKTMFLFSAQGIYTEQTWTIRRMNLPRAWAVEEIPVKDKESVRKIGKEIVESFSLSLMKNTFRSTCS